MLIKKLTLERCECLCGNVVRVSGRLRVYVYVCVCMCMCVYVCMTCSTRGLRLGAPAEQEMLLNRHARMSFCRWNVESATARAALKSCDQGLDSTKTRCTMPTRRSECRSARGSAPFRFPLLIESRSNTSVGREA